MMRFLFIALVVFAAWYGWHHYAELNRQGSHQVIVINHTGHPLERLRIRVGEAGVVFEKMDNGAQAKQPFKTEHDGPFQLTWELGDVLGERSWSGGVCSHGPILFAYRFDFREGDGVIWTSEKLPSK
jgi:hypothetical protein